MRILHIDTGREMRGGQWQVLYLLRGLREQNHESTLLAREGSPLARQAEREGFEVKPAGLLNVRRLSEQHDIVHAHDARGHTLAAIAGAHNLIVARRVAFPVKTGPLSKWKYERAARFIAVSNYVRQRLLEAGIDETRIRVVYDGVPMLEPKPAGDRIIAPAVKGASLAVDAARIAGVDLTFSTDLSKDLPGAKALLYLTEEEGLGSAILLAMSAGVPVLASAIGGIPELIQDGETGLLTTNEPNSIAIRLTRLLNDPTCANKLTQNARTQLEHQFTTTTTTNQTLKIYRDLVGQVSDLPQRNAD